MSSSTISAEFGPESSDRQSTVLVVEEAGVRYGNVTVLRDVSFTLAGGQALALVGPNGAGKTTLLRTILGLTPLVAGRVEVLGQSAIAARRRVAYVPQVDRLDETFPVSAFDVVLMGRYRHAGWLRRPSPADKAIARDALERVGLAAHGHRRFGVLSGGQRQRVLLARAVAQRCGLLLLDEPFNGLDRDSVATVIRVLAELRAEGAAVVMSVHDLDIAHEACTHACVLDGAQLAFGPVESVLETAALATVLHNRGAHH